VRERCDELPSELWLVLDPRGRGGARLLPPLLEAGAGAAVRETVDAGVGTADAGVRGAPAAVVNEYADMGVPGSAVAGVRGERELSAPGAGWCVDADMSWPGRGEWDASEKREYALGTRDGAPEPRLVCPSSAKLTRRGYSPRDDLYDFARLVRNSVRSRAFSVCHLYVREVMVMANDTGCGCQCELAGAARVDVGTSCAA
jgi:hypothetical protein